MAPSIAFGGLAIHLPKYVDAADVVGLSIVVCLSQYYSRYYVLS
jgi:hypothetical protein